MNVDTGRNCDKYISKTFSLNEGFYKSLLLKMTDVDSYNTWELSLAGFDLLGIFSKNMRTCKRERKDSKLFQVFILLTLNR